ncbi:hypothetical protein M422DRAFT_256274 [Sphaerobolus stellatus SS14]|uniref:Unplaced genomic scaffold SPHSTscaffold_66, whole genome shotgun sequence n=1 Tax=Sphaerobolus stellatus (strain SS14) TaxID=990650 RepID=A0A0C9VHE0_SPHS4|nr:hypothetical protein M422DRAFT_256274 [Sphaerobolus stellatus SS14]
MSFSLISGNFALSALSRRDPYTSATNEPEEEDCIYYRSRVMGNDTEIPTIIRVFLPRSSSPVKDATLANIHGRFFTTQDGTIFIEAIHVTYYSNWSISSLSAAVPRPRVTISGHVHLSIKMDSGTVLFHLKAFAYVSGLYQLSSAIGAIVPNKRWPNGPPIPKPFSPVHITGPIDCIDSVTGFPVVTVEDFTPEIGNRKAEIPNYRSGLLPDLKFSYRTSTASLASIIPSHGLWPAVLERNPGDTMDTGIRYDPFTDNQANNIFPPPYSDQCSRRFESMVITTSLTPPLTEPASKEGARVVTFDPSLFLRTKGNSDNFPSTLRRRKTLPDIPLRRSARLNKSNAVPTRTLRRGRSADNGVGF